MQKEITVFNQLETWKVPGWRIHEGQLWRQEQSDPTAQAEVEMPKSELEEGLADPQTGPQCQGESRCFPGTSVGKTREPNSPRFQLCGPTAQSDRTFM